MLNKILSFAMSIPSVKNQKVVGSALSAELDDTSVRC